MAYFTIILSTITITARIMRAIIISTTRATTTTSTIRATR